jgi:hypothetical protein
MTKSAKPSGVTQSQLQAVDEASRVRDDVLGDKLKRTDDRLSGRISDAEHAIAGVGMKLAAVESRMDTLEAFAGPPPMPRLVLHGTVAKEAAGAARVRITLDSPARAVISYKLDAVPTAEGRTEAGRDLIAQDGTAGEIPVGSSEVIHLVELIDNDFAEGDRWFYVRIRDVIGARVAAHFARVVISDDDAPTAMGYDPIMVKDAAPLFPHGQEYTFVRPAAWMDGSPADEARGLIDIHVSAADAAGRIAHPEIRSARLLIDGAPHGEPFYTATQLDTKTLADGPHVIGLELLDGADLHLLRPESIVLVVANGHAMRGDHVPVVGPSTPYLRLNGAAYDAVRSRDPSSPARPPVQLIVRDAPPAHRAEENPETLINNDDRWYVDAICHTAGTAGHPIASWRRTRSGWLIAKHILAKDRTAFPDGDRNQGMVSSRSAWVADPTGSGWFGIDTNGRIARLDSVGSVSTMVGPRLSADEAPRDETAGIDQDVEWMGEFDVRFSNPSDICLDPKNPRIAYVADSGNHRIARVDLSSRSVTTHAGIAGQSGDRDGKVSQAKFSNPRSLAMLNDGSMFVADDSGIRLISIKGETTRVLDRHGAGDPACIRTDSEGTLIVGDRGGRVLAYDWRTGLLSVLASGLERADRMWLAVDIAGNVGPKDDIIVATGSNLVRISRDGTRNTPMLRGSYGRMQHGIATYVIQPAGRKPWTVAIDDSESRILVQGLEDDGPRQIKLRGFPDGDFRPDAARFAAGRHVWLTGTVPGFPFGMRPSFASLSGTAGFGMLSTVPNLDEMRSWTDGQIAAHFRAGGGGSVPRPELVGSHMDDLVYFVRCMQHNMDQLLSPPGARMDAEPPQVKNLIATRDGDGIVVRFETNELAFAVLAVGSGPDMYHRWAHNVDSGVRTAHELRISHVQPGWSYVIRVMDAFGNQSQTEPLIAP